jgi:hypothetical protein
VKGAVAAVVYWAVVHGIFALVLLGWTTDALQVGMLGGSAVLFVLVGLAILAYRAPRLRVLPQLSVPTILLAFGIGSAISGVAFGLWLVLLGSGAIVIALAALANELVAERRAAR